MKTYYNGYIFSYRSKKPVYNPTLALYFLEQFTETCLYPRKMLDSNLATDEQKLEYIALLPNGENFLMTLMEKDNSVHIPDIIDRFGVYDLLSDKSHDHSFLVSFLYYFGVLTISAETDGLEAVLKVPNLVMKSLYVERMQKMFFPDPGNRDQGKEAAKLVYTKGDIEPLCRFVEEKYFKIFSNRDYKWANELTIKTAFLTLLYNDIIFIMDSEPEIDRRYADLVMIIRPDKRYGKVFDVLIEFKFVSLKDARLTSQQAKNLSLQEISSLSLMQAKIKDGETQVKEYAKILEDRYQNLRLKRFVVISLGFERVCNVKIEP